MEFDWTNSQYDTETLTPKDIEESFEDPFSIRLLPDEESAGGEARYFCLGRSIGNVAVLSVFWTDGKRYRVIYARRMTDGELNFYERKVHEQV